ncbi:histidine triad nucleotide-binding protein [Nitrospira sp.]|nr:histidine triad nucleotide-binding protein [Nitrospira sp.]
MNDCLFCRIVTGDIPAKVVYQDDETIAFDDINPQAPTHVLVIPRGHVASVEACGEDHGQMLGSILFACAKVARLKGLPERGYRIVTNTGPDAGQSVFHLHFHVLGGRQLGWPPG